MLIPGVTVETPYAIIRDTVMTREKYQEAGRRIADGLIMHVQNPGLDRETYQRLKATD
jgi:hypothetical protein